MAIQFCCTHCGQPIEVDEEHAGKTAACPYCHHLIGVPQESTYQPGFAVNARPASNAPAGTGPTPDDQPGIRPVPYSLEGVPPPSIRQQHALIFGKFALLCAVVAVVLLACMLVAATRVALRIGVPTGYPTMSPEMIEQFQKAPEAPWITMSQCGWGLFAISGTVLAVVSLMQSARGNWRGWTSLAVCGGMLLCICGAFVLGLVLSGGGLAGA